MADPIAVNTDKKKLQDGTDEDAIVAKALKKRKGVQPSKIAAACGERLLEIKKKKCKKEEDTDCEKDAYDKLAGALPSVNNTLMGSSYGASALQGLPTSQSLGVPHSVGDGQSATKLGHQKIAMGLGGQGAIGGGIAGAAAGAIPGALIGGGIGAMAPGNDEEGEQRSRLAQMLQKGLLGAGVGAAAGGLGGAGLGYAAGSLTADQLAALDDWAKEQIQSSPQQPEITTPSGPMGPPNDAGMPGAGSLG